MKNGLCCWGTLLALAMGCGGDPRSEEGTLTGAQSSATAAATDDAASTGATGDTTAPTSSVADGSETGEPGTTGSGGGGAEGEDSVGSVSSAAEGTSRGSDDGTAGSEESGTTGELDDNDGDGIPNHDDPFPGNDDLPGIVTPNLVYAHSGSTLYTMEVAEPYAVTEIAAFTFPDGEAGSVTDIAIDRFGVLYAITYDDLHVCEPDTAACHWLAALPDQSNGLTFVPPGTVVDDDDSLIGIAISGNWRNMELSGGMVNQVLLGSYGAGYSSSGDSFSIDGVGTFASVDAGGNAYDVIVEIDPTTGAVLMEVGTLTGYTSVYGIAGWEGAIFAFDESGDVLLVNPTDGTFEVINDTTTFWWGAAVSTQLPV